MEEMTDELQAARQHDERVFHAGQAIFSQDDLRELINYTYSEYQYKGAQLDKLAGLIDFLGLESNKYINPELADQSRKFSVYLNNFRDFLQTNFLQGKQTEEGDTLFVFQIQGTGPENEAFLAEFQMLAVDIESAYRKYRSAVTSKLKI
jgi:hypothetical protein